MADEIAYRDLQLGEVIQEGDEWRTHDTGTVCWQVFHSGMHGRPVCELIGNRARRPYNITQMNAAIAMQTEVLAEVRTDEKRLCEQLESLRSEYVTMQQQRDQAAHEYRLHREALTTEQEAHKATMANGLQACKDRDRLIVELNECQQQCQHLQAALEELQRRRDASAGSDTPTVAEVVENILSALEIASHAMEYLADVGVHEEAGHYIGFGAAIAVVRKIKESTK